MGADEVDEMERRLREMGIEIDADTDTDIIYKYIKKDTSHNG